MKNTKVIAFAALAAFAAFVVEAISASLGTFLYFIGIVPQTYESCLKIAVVVLIIFLSAIVGGIILLNVVFSKKGYKSTTLLTAITYTCVLVIFTAVVLVMASFGTEPIYTFLFLGYKVFTFGVLSRVASAAIISASIFAVCVIAFSICGIIGRASKNSTDELN